jgi:hypothetical protein
MGRRVLQAVFLIWLCSYLAGPLVQTVDVWDTPQEEMVDMASSLCGMLIWAACGVGLAIFALRRLTECCGDLLQQYFELPLLLPSALPVSRSSAPGEFVFVGSPPLRI